jgi:hypothetical protein
MSETRSETHVGSLYFSIERLGVTAWGAAGVPATALAICAQKGHSCFSSTDQAGRSDWGHLGDHHRRGERSLTSDLAHCFPKLVLSNVLTVAIQLRIRTYIIQFTSAVMRVPSRRAEGSFGHTHTTRLHLVLIRLTKFSMKQHKLLINGIHT